MESTPPMHAAVARWQLPVLHRGQRIDILYRPRFLHDVCAGSPAQIPCVRSLKDEFTSMPVGVDQRKAHFRFIGESKERDRWIPRGEVVVSDTDGFFQISMLAAWSRDYVLHDRGREEVVQLRAGGFGQGKPVRQRRVAAFDPVAGRALLS